MCVLTYRLKELLLPTLTAGEKWTLGAALASNELRDYDAAEHVLRYSLYLLYWYKSTCFTGTKVTATPPSTRSGTQFTCFTGTKVQILTLRAQARCRRGPARRAAVAHSSVAGFATKFTCFTSTKVQILTGAAADHLPLGRGASAAAQVRWRMLAYADAC